MNGVLYLATYGSVMDGRQMCLMSDSAELIGYGMLDGYRLLFRGNKNHAIASLEANDGASVPFALWEIPADDAINFDLLNRFPDFTNKRLMDVTVQDIQVSAIIYSVKDTYPINLPSKCYLENMLDVYESVGIDPSALENALDYCADYVEMR